MSDNSHIDPHSALTSLWPSDTEESKKLAEEKQIKRQNLTDLGAQFRQAREALGYNISDLNEHTGLSFTELEALEQGLFQHIEQQDYVDYYIHTYAALLSLDADQVLANFRQNYYQVEAPSNDDEQTNDSEINLHDEAQYEDAFSEEARKTIEALDASGIDTLKAADQIETEPDTNQAEQFAPEILTQETPVQDLSAPEIKGLQADSNHEPITSNPRSKPFPWLKLALSFIFVLIVAGGAYFANSQFGFGQTTDQLTENAASLNDNNINVIKDADRVPEAQKAKKIGTLESKIITQGSDDLSAPTATMVQKPLVLIGQTSTDVLTEVSENIGENIGDIITDATKDNSTSSAVKETVETATEAVRKIISEDLAKATELANAAEATKIAAAELAAQQAADATSQTDSDDAQLPKDPIQEALAQLPTDNAKFSLHASKNSWVLIEDDAAQILFSGELTPEQIFTFPKVAGVIISLGDAGVIDVYKGKQLLGKLGAIDETLDLVSVEQRFNQISN